MSTLAWVIIGVLAAIIIALVVVAAWLLNFSAGFVNAFIMGMGGPDLRKKK